MNGSKWSEQSRRGRARWLADICSDACRRRLGEIGVSREIEREREREREERRRLGVRVSRKGEGWGFKHDWKRRLGNKRSGIGKR